MKAELDLFNEFWLRTEREEQFSFLRDGMRKARAFAISDEIDEMVADLALKDMNDLKTARHLASARLPYPVMWIEHGNRGFGRRLPPGINRMFGEPERTGWLLRETTGPEGEVHGFMVHRVSRVVNETSGDLTASLYPLYHRVVLDEVIDYDLMLQEQLKVTPEEYGTHPDALLALTTIFEMHTEPSTALIAWGGVDSELSIDMPQEEAGALMRASPLYGKSMFALENDFLKRIIEGSFDVRQGVVSFVRNSSIDQLSELRYLVAALALMNEVPVEFVPFKPSGNVRMGGRLRPFMSSSVVSITVPQSRRRLKDIDKLLQARGKEAQKKARHEVRGHYRHLTKLPAKNPERYEPFVTAEGRKVWRTFIAHHMRGSLEKGWVDQRYAVVSKHPTDDYSDRIPN